MKIPFLLRIALVIFTLSLVGNHVAKAQDVTTPPSPGLGGHHHDAVLTEDERAELKADREKVFDANPDLKTEGKDLMDQRSSMKDASDEDKQAFHEKMHAFMDKMDDAIEKIDPNAAPLIAKMKAAHHHPKPDDSSSNQ